MKPARSLKVGYIPSNKLRLSSIAFAFLTSIVNNPLLAKKAFGHLS
jgi:hypothetical protein